MDKRARAIAEARIEELAQRAGVKPIDYETSEEHFLSYRMAGEDRYLSIDDVLSSIFDRLEKLET